MDKYAGYTDIAKIRYFNKPMDMYRLLGFICVFPSGDGDGGDTCGDIICDDGQICIDGVCGSGMGCDGVWGSNTVID